ncbi:uncharacterized protein MEPE_06684 [Melanopsichium pennsylvanicum]|uniref:Uncharacterized protein n=2 Tax=Melanopsichium pennsylvanicum TaxID=63383 RepID=A0AAJ5C8S7_9BASI|nr:conserved hypothetical protein [Melanopsichium pennsylvanicum 4]SNX87973.1 uncharacterized protein MEPE_06684 [Melanopsichium pennsylvanicum]
MSNSGNSIGDAVKGALDVIHGAGESIRGNINQGLDSAGEGLRNADSSQHSTTNEAAHGRSSDYTNQGSQQGVADKGAQEFKSGVDKLTGAFNKNNSSSSTH